MDLTITSNGLSLIKSILDFLDLILNQEENEKLEADINICSFSSITNALNLRNIIECFALINMNEQGDITDSQKMLFVEQYKLIEYKLYFEDGRFDEIIDRTDLRFRYLMGLKKFQSVEESEKKIERFFKTRIPFLCQKNINFNDKKYENLINEHSMINFEINEDLRQEIILNIYITLTRNREKFL